MSKILDDQYVKFYHLLGLKIFTMLPLIIEISSLL